MKMIQDRCIIIILEVISLVNYHNALKLAFWGSGYYYCILTIVFAAYLWDVPTALALNLSIPDCHYNKNKGLVWN